MSMAAAAVEPARFSSSSSPSSSSSNFSSSTLPPRGILRSKSTSDVSLNMSEESCRSHSITFAPLPAVEERKRRNARPTGVAGRAEMLRRSKRPIEMTHDDYEDDGYRHASNEQEDLALPDVGKFVKGLIRSLSRSKKYSFDKGVRSGTLDGMEDSKEEEEGEGEGEGRVWEESIGTWVQTATFQEPFRALHKVGVDEKAEDDSKVVGQTP